MVERQPAAWSPRLTKEFGPGNSIICWSAQEFRALLDLAQLVSSCCSFSSTAHFACHGTLLPAGDNPPFPATSSQFPPFQLGALGVPRDQTARGL
ncbi:hypothetical protein DUI87_03567 [Hirundo rustica rustica]|uniref:Uncharacterized protein n=1 Tax=Hirundo rustica rustica TaxID=333673 RepID=A0A3M0L0J2_HIRRU|nr:hypothetical protein DUI87_03567 [Hirundo rustica rustica]